MDRFADVKPPSPWIRAWVNHRNHEYMRFLIERTLAVATEMGRAIEKQSRLVSIPDLADGVNEIVTMVTALQKYEKTSDVWLGPEEEIQQPKR